MPSGLCWPLPSVRLGSGGQWSSWPPSRRGVLAWEGGCRGREAARGYGEGCDESMLVMNNAFATGGWPRKCGFPGAGGTFQCRSHWARELVMAAGGGLPAGVTLPASSLVFIIRFQLRTIAARVLGSACASGESSSPESRLPAGAWRSVLGAGSIQMSFLGETELSAGLRPCPCFYSYSKCNHQRVRPFADFLVTSDS